MPRLACLLVSALLAAQPPAGGVIGSEPVFRTELGADTHAAIRLVPPHAWDGLLLGVQAPPPRPARRGQSGATVEVWDFALRSTARQEAFSLYLGDLTTRLLRAWELPPPSHGRLELAELMYSDPANPQKLDLTKVKSLQDRFNRLPPNGSPVR